jgi:hypothetical protein
MPLEGGIRPGSVPDAELVASRAEAGPAAESEASPDPAS